MLGVRFCGCVSPALYKPIWLSNLAFFHYHSDPCSMMGNPCKKGWCVAGFQESWSLALVMSTVCHPRSAISELQAKHLLFFSLVQAMLRELMKKKNWSHRNIQWIWVHDEQAAVFVGLRRNKHPGWSVLFVEVPVLVGKKCELWRQASETHSPTSCCVNNLWTVIVL